ncbi:MAG: tRNA 2-thiocytidine biosynthesis protein TtcA [Christensenellaceae bacterium]|nr:tRNA 2-thiocytidine biosynthesis protein TtcA [Christensenellaceae bacterium]
MEKYQEVERSLITKYRRDIWRPFVTAVVQYRLIDEGDAVTVCISGGKDSMIMAKCVQELQRHGPRRFRAEYVVMDPGYNPENRQLILDNARLLNIPVKVFDTPIFGIVDSVDDGNPCYLCARMRRGYLYKYAQSLGCNKIALGHHYDDAFETTLLSMMYAGEIRAMMPKLRSTSHPGMELIRPMYHVREHNIVRFAQRHSLRFLQCACRFTENIAKGDQPGRSKRQEVKLLLARLREQDPLIDRNIFHSMQNVNLEKVIAWRDKSGIHHFLDDY